MIVLVVAEMMPNVLLRSDWICQRGRRANFIRKKNYLWNTMYCNLNSDGFIVLDRNSTSSYRTYLYKNVVTNRALLFLQGDVVTSSLELVREDAPHCALRDVTFVRTMLFCVIICHHEALAGAHCPSLSSPFHDNL
jgi:hypothetical protein